MIVTTPLATHYSPNLALLCAHVERIHKEDNTKQFRIRRNSGGLWKMVVY